VTKLALLVLLALWFVTERVVRRRLFETTGKRWP
jgi:hypothetical protein